MKKILLPLLVSAAIIVAPLTVAAPALASTSPVTHPIVIGPYRGAPPQLLISAKKASASLVTSSGIVNVRWHKEERSSYIITISETHPTSGLYVLTNASAKGKHAMVELLRATKAKLEAGKVGFTSKAAFIRALKRAAQKP